MEQKEDLIDRLDRILEWIKACDTKSSILLAGIGLVVTILSSEQCLKKYQQILIYTLKNINNWKITYIVICSVSLLLIFSGVILFLLELTPSLISRRNKNNKTNSLYFFGTISTKKLDDFKKEYLQKSLETDIQDLLNQIYFNAKISHIKYRYTKWGIVVSTVGGIVFGLMFILGCILVNKT